MGDSGTFSSSRKNREDFRLSEHNCGSVAPLYDVYFSNWKWDLPAGSRSMSKGCVDEEMISPARWVSQRDHCLDNWHNLSPVIRQELVVSIPRLVVAVFQAESGVMCY
ncbi:DDE_3 domain-containing protein [Trichonephila clavipes]|nr:DDE_3 domain-containing protein [Trichonephila clavipes]